MECTVLANHTPHRITQARIYIAQTAQTIHRTDPSNRCLMGYVRCCMNRSEDLSFFSSSLVDINSHAVLPMV